jgi:predicted nuclease of restriction endonuclease-like (RecB) superfamily
MEAKSHLPANPKDFIRNPAVLEFLGLTASKSYTETQLEQSLIVSIRQSTSML